MIHVMADIETLSTRHDGLILSVGGVKFDAEQIVDRFHVGIDPTDAQERYGRHISAGTFIYWLGPKMEQARKELLELPKVDMFAALDGFAIWCAQTPADQCGSLWGKGSTFDNVLLADSFAAAGIEFPFTYRQNECYRTMANRNPDIEYVQIGTAHNGVADAESQAVHLQEICRARGIVL